MAELGKWVSITSKRQLLRLWRLNRGVASRPLVRST